MTVTPHLDGVILASELGPEFWLDTETRADEGIVLVRVKLGENMYLSRDSALNARTQHHGLTSIDWLWLLLSWAMAITVGAYLGWTSGQWGRVSWLLLGLLLAFIFGWVLRMVHHRYRHG